MGVMDRYNKKKKQEEEESKSESSSLGGVQSRFEVNKTLGPSNHEVNESFINKFVSDVNNFLGSAEEEIGTVGWSNASSIYDTRYNSWKDLYSRSNSISRWLDENKSNLTEDSYKSLSSNLNSFRTNSSSVLDSFKSARDYYSAWDSEVAYNRWYEKTKKQEEERAAVLGAEDFDKYFNQGNEYGEEQSVWDKLTGKAYNSIANMRNDPNALKVYEESAKGANGASWGTSERVLTNQIEYKAAKYMTDDEFKVYNYYYGKDAENGTDTAKKFLESIEESLNMRAADEKFADLEGRTFKELLFGVTAGLDQFESGLINLFDSKSDYIPATPTQMTSGMVREDLADNGAKLPDWMGGASIGQMGYDMVTTTSNMLPSILTSAVANVVAPGSGAIIGAGLLGASASGNAYAEMLNLGYDKGQARAYSLLVGAAEAGLQYALGGISKLGGKVSGNAISKFVSKFDNAIARAAIKLGGNMLSEGLEESIQSVLEPVFKSISTGEEFEGIAWDEVLYSGLMGAMSAGILEGTGTISGEITAYTKGKALKETGTESIDRLVSLGQTFSADSVAYQLAGKVNEQTGAYTIGRLLNEVGASLSEQNKADITKALVEKGMTSKDANTISKWLGKAVDGGYFTKGQIAALESNEVISSVFQDVIINQNSTVNQRIQGYNESIHTLAEEMSRGKAVEKATAKATEVQQTSSEPTAMLSNEEFVRRVSEATGLDATAVAQGLAQQAGDENTTAEEIATEGKFKASQTGKAKMGDTEVSIKEIASVKGGEMILRLEDGSTVNASDVEYGSSAEALIYENVADMNLNAATANAFVKGYDPSEGLSAQEYVLGFREAYRYGEYGFPVQEMSKDGFSAKLSQTQRSLAYDLGKTDMKYKVSEAKSLKEKIASTSAKNAEKIASTGAKKGKVHYAEGILVKSVTQRQQASLKGLERLAEALGVEFHIFESEVGENGKRKGANGWFDPKDGSIHLDLHAGLEGEGTILFTAAHELTHFIREWSPEKFKVFADFLLEQYGKKGISVDALVRNQIAKAKRNGRDIDFDTAYEEVIADSCESMLADGEIMQKLAELKAKDKTLWEKIKSFIADLVAKIKAAYEGLSPDSIEGRYVAEMLDAAERLKELWTEALVDASEASALVEIDAETESVSPMFSERTWTESEYVIHRDQMAEKIADALGVSVQKAKSYIDDINSIAKMIADDRVRLDYEASSFGSAFVSNVEYGGSFDYTTLCKKRRIYTGTFTEIQKRLKDVALTPDDILTIRNLLIKEGVEATCGLCYVEGSRANMGKFAKEFIRLYKRDNPNAWIPNMADVNTPDGVEQMRINHPDVYEQYVYFWNHYGKLKDSDPALFASQQKPKLYEARKEYKGEILEHFKGDSTVTKKNLNGGIRMQSFSDFEIVHLIDTMQVIMDMSTVGLAGQAYTKVPEFARAFGNTGLKINLSLIAKGVDADGKLILDDREGMPHETAFELRERYSQNVGTIIVTFTDEQLLAAMADPRIDFIIPFHRSQWKKGQYGAMGLPKGTKDYTFMQNEKLIKQTYHEYRGRMVKDKASNYMPNEYWDFSKSGKENAEAYLKMCAENNKRPKFYKLLDYDGKGAYSLKADGSTDGYWKLLIDFKMYDNDGVGSPQMAVTPTFNMDEAKTMLDEYNGGHSKYPVASGVVEAFVDEYNEVHGTKYSDRYQSADTNSDILSMVEKVENGDFKANDKIDLGIVSDAAAAEIYNITGINVEGFKVAIEARQINHIIKDHGKNGIADRSMADPTDIAKIEFALEDYDDIRAAGKTQAYTHMVNGRNKTADTVLYEKSIGEKAYYVVQAVPNTKAKTLYIVTAFIGKKGYKKEASQLIDAKSPDATAKTGSADTSVHSIPQTDESVNSKFSDRDPDSVSNRSLLANALESVAQNDIERNKLKEYKGKIALIESEQAKLAEVKAQIKELSFAKGKRDTEAIKKLQFEANQSANRINTYDRQLLNLEATAALKGVLQREKQLAYKKAEREGKDALAKYREKAAKTQRELLTRYQESRAKGVEGRKKTEMRYKIKSITSELDTLLRRPTSKKHIKEELRAEVADALLAINMDTVGADERVARYNEMIAKVKDPDIISELTKTRDRIQLQGDNLKEKLTSLQSAYEKIKASDDIELSMSYQEVIRNSIKNVTDKVGNTSIRNMSLEQLEMVYDLFSMIRKTIRNANKAFNEQKGQTIMQMAEAVNDQVRTVGGQPYERSAVVAAVQRAGWALLKPYVAFRTIGSVTLTNLYKELRNGEDTFYGDVKEAQAFIEEQYEKHGYKSWDMKTTKTFTAKSGKSFDLTLEQIMTLYAYSRREQAHKHIIEGGVVFENAIITKKNKLGVPIKYEVTTKDAFNLSEETFAEIANSLTAEQKAFVDAMQEYLSKTMGAKGNEVSMELLGVKLFKEEFYLPIKSSQDYRNFSAEEAGEVKLKSPAFSKETVQQANNPIVLHNFTDLWAEHINDMSMYHSFVLALEDFTRVYNYKTKTDAKVETMSTKATLETAFPGATTYINKFLKDMNGGVRSETVGGLEKLTSLAKKGAVLGSASVAIQQPSAVMRAMAMVDPKHFVATTLKSLNLVKHKQDWAELKKYAPIAGIKEMGRFDVGMGQETVDWIKANKTVMNKVEDGLSIAPALMDEITWVSIWNAVKREVLHNRKDLRPGSEEFFKAAGERFTDVISLTQVYDSVFSRSDIMRNKSWIAKAATAFMAEPTTTLNMIIDSFVQGKRTGSKKGFFKNTVPVSGAIVASYVINAALKSIITAARDDDEDESYAEKYLEHFFGDFKDSLNPLTLVPVAKDIVSIFRGYDVERMDMSLFSDFSKAIEAFSSDNKTLYEKWSGLISTTSAFFGIPVKNVERDIRAAINVFFGKREATTKQGLLDAISEGWTGETKSNGQQLYEAMLSGDAEHIERIKGRFEDESSMNSAIRTAIKEGYTNGDIDYETAMEHLVKYGGMEDEDDAHWAIDKWDYAAENGSSDDYSKYGDFYTAVETGKNLKAVIKEYMDNGVSEKTLQSQITSHFKDTYASMPKSKRASLKGYLRNAMTYCGMTTDEANTRLQYWDFLAEHPDIDAEESWIKEYHADGVSDAGISIEVFVDYRNKVKGMTGETKKQDRMAVINSLPISTSQKDALYHAEGWAASKLHEAPWH